MADFRVFTFVTIAWDIACWVVFSNCSLQALLIKYRGNCPGCLIAAYGPNGEVCDWIWLYYTKAGVLPNSVSVSSPGTQQTLRTWYMNQIAHQFVLQWKKEGSTSTDTISRDLSKCSPLRLQHLMFDNLSLLLRPQTFTDRHNPNCFTTFSTPFSWQHHQDWSPRSPGLVP